MEISLKSKEEVKNRFMQRALDLASNGLGHVSPNPMVGCVIVHKDRIIGEGFHHHFGGPHAEVEAVNSVKDKGLLSQSTMYVTLEPCNHKGKTPPCTDLILEHGIPRVVLATTDPNPRVNGKGIERLQSGGVQVDMDVDKEHADRLNRRFIVSQLRRMPYIILKWAETGDGFVASTDEDVKWISNQYSRQLVHRWRSEEDAILVGRSTVEIDDPALTTRDWEGKNPTRVIIDPTLKLTHQGMQIFDEAAPTLVYNTVESSTKHSNEWVKVKGVGFLENILQDLRDRGIQSVIVEGGTNTIMHFINNDLWHEARVFRATDVFFGGGVAAPILRGNPSQTFIVQKDIVRIYENRIDDWKSRH